MCLRVLFIPLFMLCHVPEKSRLPDLFSQDAYFITFMLLFAVSNGYLVSLTMCLAPRSADGPKGLGVGRWGPACRAGLLLLCPARPGPSCLQATLPGPAGSWGGAHLGKPPRHRFRGLLSGPQLPGLGNKWAGLLFARAQLLPNRQLKGS